LKLPTLKYRRTRGEVCYTAIHWLLAPAKCNAACAPLSPLALVVANLPCTCQQLVPAKAAIV